MQTLIESTFFIYYKMTRQEYNYLILEKITKVVKDCPDLRFGQILWNIGILDWEEMTDCRAIPIIRDIYNDESKDIYERCMH